MNFNIDSPHIAILNRRYFFGGPCFNLSFSIGHLHLQKKAWLLAISSTSYVGSSVFIFVEGWSTEASAMQLGNPRRGWLPQRSNGWRQTETVTWIPVWEKRGSRRWVEFWLESEFHVDCWLLGNLSWIALRFIHKDQQQQFDNKGVADFRVWGRSELVFFFHKTLVTNTEAQSATQDGNGTKSVSFLEFAFWYSRPGALSTRINQLWRFWVI